MTLKTKRNIIVWAQVLLALIVNIPIVIYLFIQVFTYLAE